jgi:hypothetical protein
MFHVSFCLTAHSAFTVSWLFNDVPLTISFMSALSWADIFLPLDLSYITTTGISFYLLTAIQGPIELLVHCFRLNSPIFLLSVLN